MIRTGLILAVLAALLAGCGNTYGGVTKKEAIAAARDGVATNLSVQGIAAPKTTVDLIKRSYDERAKHDAWWVALRVRGGKADGELWCFFVMRDSDPNIGLRVHSRPCQGDRPVYNGS